MAEKPWRHIAFQGQSHPLSHGAGNQLATVSRTGTMTVAGTTTESATSVTVETLTATLFADATFAKDGFTLADGNNTFTAIAQDAYGRRDTNVSTSYLPATSSFVYDLNGNLRTNGTRYFDYDDENQLIRITESNAWKAEFSYDGKMRRRNETNFTWQASAWVVTNVTRFVYDGNVPIQHRDENNLPVQTLTRGTDLSGTYQGAGGIGGLLALTSNSELLSPNSSAQASSFYHCDGNGNVSALIAANQLLVARYIYDPYGNTLSISGPKADINRYRFSSKPVHDLAGMYDYLYRWYSPNMQRWLNRDPLGDIGSSRLLKLYWRAELLRGGGNLYTFVLNQPINAFDVDGRLLAGALEELFHSHPIGI